MVGLKVVFAVSSIIGLLSTAQAADSCEAIVLHNVGAIEDLPTLMKKGDTDYGVSQYNVDRKTGVASLCSRGGYCFPTSLRIGGKKVETLRLTNCTVGRKLKSFDNDIDTYDLVLGRSEIASDRLAIYDAANRLLGLGLCTGCAAGAADAYVEKPTSECGKLASATLHGSKKALARLQNVKTPCNK